MAKNKLRIRKGDTVVVVAGKDKGKTGRVVRVFPETRRVTVEGVAVAKRHQKGEGDQPGGIIYKEASIDISNVSLWDAEGRRRVKVGYAVVDGKKVRVDRKSGTPIDNG